MLVYSWVVCLIIIFLSAVSAVSAGSTVVCHLLCTFIVSRAAVTTLILRHRLSCVRVCSDSGGALSLKLTKSLALQLARYVVYPVLACFTRVVS